MKILLVNLKESYKEKAGPFPFIIVTFAPLNLQILASLTPNEEVEIVDENFDEIDFDGGYDLVGLTGYGVSRVSRAKEVYKEFKKRSIPVVIGGPSVFFAPLKDALKCADSIVLGEGEGAWERVVKDVKNNKLKKVYRNKELVDLSKLNTLPRRDLTNNKNYMRHPVEISRGCPYNCDFCTLHKFNKGQYRLYSIKRVVRDVEQCLEYLAKRRRQIFFVDNNLVIKPEYKIKLFEKFIPYNIIWSGQCDISVAKNKKLLNAFSKSGCLSLGIGFESINQESLKSVNKLTNRVSEYKKVVKILHDYGIAVLGYFMLGLDYDKPGVAKKTLDFISDADIDIFGLNIITPAYGTRLFERLEKEGRILTKDWIKYDGGHAVFQPKNMTPQQLEKEYKWLIDHSSSRIYNLAPKILIKRSILNKNIKFATRLLILSHYASNAGIYYAKRCIQKFVKHGEPR